MKLLLLIGTRKGAFIASAAPDRRHWTLTGPLFKGTEINQVAYDPASGTLAACGKSGWFGPVLQLSTDLGATWHEPAATIRFADDRGKSVDRIWTIVPDPRVPKRLYGGVDPGALFVSDDAGANWRELPGITDHPTRDRWSPGAGGLMVHSIACDRTRPSRMTVGISAAGAFRTDDGGESWTPKNAGVRADFMPDKFPEVGQCVHHMEGHPQKPDVLYQQNHCGVYRSDNAGDSWVDISEGL